MPLQKQEVHSGIRAMGATHAIAAIGPSDASPENRRCTMAPLAPVAPVGPVAPLAPAAPVAPVALELLNRSLNQKTTEKGSQQKKRSH